jgi:hypothetical protein
MSSLQFLESRSQSGPKLPLRSTLVTLKSGHRILISPVKFTDAQLAELKQSPPHALVAPNKLHHLYIKKAAEDLNVTTIFVAPGLEKKRPDIEWPVILSDKTWIYQDELPMLVLKGIPALNECVFFHKETKTLIVTDLFFNLFDLPDNFSSLLFKMLGTFNRPAISRLTLLVTRDKKALRASLTEILKWDFDRMVMAHGKVIESGAKEIFINAAKERGLLE